MSDLTPLTQKIEALEARMDKDLAKRRTANLVTVVIGAVLFVAILLYFGFAHSLIKEVTEPDRLAALARGYVEDNLTGVMARIQLEARDMAPEAMKEARRQALLSLPEIRQWLEQESMVKAEPFVTSLEREIGIILGQGISGDREAFDAFVVDPDDHEAREKFRAVVVTSLKSYFDEPMVKADLDSFADVMKSYDEKLKRLRDNVDLTPGEKLERELILSMRELAKRSDITFVP